MRAHLKPLPLVLSVLLAACASAPPQATRPPLAIEAPAAEAARQASAPPADEPAIPRPTADVWERLRGSFVMDDCDADPSVLAQAKHYTRHPKQFENQLQTVLPRLVYVQQVAEQYGVAGEFVLLPWVESHFQPLPGRKHRPAGMWQIMPVTAGAMGLRVDGHYDGRLDIPAAANAVMKLLQQYHDQFQDWRVAAYAYNAGEFAIRKIIRAHGMPADKPTIPHWPVQKVTRGHLVKLLAMACVVREPGRFNVSLPSLPADQHLVQVPVSRNMPIARAADHAGMSVERLKHFNPAFRNGVIDTGAASYLLLPATHAHEFRDASPDLFASADVEPSAQAPHRDDAAPLASPHRRGRVHTVKPGDSLWQIARRYAVSIRQLQQWNDLDDQLIKPGQALKIDTAR